MNIHHKDSIDLENAPKSSATSEHRLCLRAGVSEEIGADAETWHQRLHMNVAERKLVDATTGGSYKHPCTTFCESCVMCNIQRKWKNTIKRRSKITFHTMHTDVGTMDDYSQGGFRHFIIFLNDNTDLWFVYYLKDGFGSEEIIHCLKRVMIATRNKVSVLHSDCAAYYTSDLLEKYCVNVGIEQSFSVPGHSDDNSKAELAVRHFKEGVRVRLYASIAPSKLWCHAGIVMCTFEIWLITNQKMM